MSRRAAAGGLLACRRRAPAPAGSVVPTCRRRGGPGTTPTHVGREGTGVRLAVGRLRPATLGVFVVLVAAGLLFAVSAVTARGTQLRSDRSDAVALARTEQARYSERLAQLKALRRE